MSSLGCGRIKKKEGEYLLREIINKVKEKWKMKKSKLIPLPEGFSREGTYHTRFQLEKAAVTGEVLEGKAVACNKNGDLKVMLGEAYGKIPKELTALGVKDGSVSDIAILSRVNKTVAFRVIGTPASSDGDFILDRVSVQEEALEFMLERLSPGDVVDGRVTHIEPFGVFVDIGYGIVGLLSVENISVSRIGHPRERFYVGQNIRVVIKSVDREMKRFNLSHKELLGTWEENAALFEIGQTVCGRVRSVEEYGVFIELTPNLAGLAEYSPEAVNGQEATVYIKNIIPEKMKVKLSIVDTFWREGAEKATPFKYFFTGDRIDSFVYSPSGAPKMIFTTF